MACTYIYEGKKYNAWEFADVLASMPIDDLVKYLPGAVAAQLSEATQASRLGYDVQARKKAYTDDRQLQLFLDSKPDPSQTGQASDRARREAVATVDDLRSTGTVLGQSLSSDYAARQRVSLVGQKVSDSEGLAILAQVYRDPRFETFRLVFTDDSGNVVSQVGLTSRLPASATAIIGDDVDAYLKDIAAAAKSTGATGFYMLHNHPSGLSKPSDADISLTQMFAASMPGIAFQSHVVIDTNEYSVIDRDGYASTEKKDFGQPKPFQDAEWGGLKIEGPADVMAMAKKLQVDDGAITLIHTNAQNQVKSITTIPESVATGKRAAQHIARAALGQNGANLFAVGRSAAALGNIGGMVTDSILVSADGTVQSLRASGAIRGGNIYPARRTPRVSPDTSAAFDYLRMPTQGGKQSSRVVAENQPEPYDQYGDPSPEEASTVEAGIQGKSPIEAAKWLEENAPRQYAIIAAKVREKLESLAGIGVDFGMEIVNVGDYAHAGLSRARGVTYPYSVDGKTRIVVAINGKDMTGRVGMSYKTVLHELVHAATSQSIQLGLSGNRNFVQPVKDLIDVMMQIGERVSKNIANGSASEFELSLADGRRNMMQSPDEVLAWALSSSEAQAYLESIEHQGKSLWSRFVDAVRSALGLSTRSNTSLSEVLRISEILLKPSSIAEILGVKTDANYSIDAKPFSFDGIPRAQQQAAGNKHVLPDYTKPDIVWSSQAIPDTIEIDGVMRSTLNSNGKPIADNQPVVLRVLGEKGLTKLIMSTDMMGFANLSPEEEAEAFSDQLRTLKRSGIQYVDFYHVTDASLSDFDNDGVRGSALDYIGSQDGNLREVSVYGYLDPRDIPKGMDGVLGASDNPNIANIRIPVDEIVHLRHDSNFSLTYGARSAVRYIGGIKKEWIHSVDKYAEVFSATNPGIRYSRTRNDKLTSLKQKAAEAHQNFNEFDKAITAGKRETDGDTYFDMIGKLLDAKKALAAELVAMPDDGFALQAKTRDGRMLILNQSAQRPGYWQLTRFDDKGMPWGDTQYQTKSQAIKEFITDSDISTITDYGMTFSFAGQSSATAEPKSTVAASRERLVEAFGKSAIQQLESIGLLNIAQTELEAIDRAAQMYAEATGQSVEDVRNSMLASIRASISTEKPLIERSGNKPNDPILVNGEADIVQLPAEITSRTGGRFLAKPVRLLNGRHFGKNRGYGIAHIEAEHGSEIGDVEEYVVSAVRNASKIYDDGSGRLLLQNVGAPKGIAFVELRDEGGYYSVVTAYNGKEKGRLIWSGRRLHLSSKGSGDMGSTMTTTAGQSGNPPSGTAQSPINPKQPLETLEDQTSASSIGGIGIDVKRSADGAIQGFYVPKLGKAFVVADNVAAQDMPAVVTHEVGVHMAMDGNPAMEKLAKQAANLIKLGRGNPFFDRIRQRMDEAGETSNEEAMAYLAEEAKKARDRVPNTVKQWLKDVVAAVKSWLFRKGVLGANRMNEDDILAVAMSYVKQAAEKKGEGQAKFSRTQWGNDFPDAFILRRAEVVHAHPDYRAAKDGDAEAAKRLVQDIVTREDLLKISQLIGKGESLIVAVHAEEAAGKNKIPAMYAAYIADQLGKRVEARIVQTKKVSRGGSDGMHRITTEVPFAGPVEENSRYLIVDDTLTQGGTLADLKGYIEENGGVVVGASTLMGKQYSSKLKPSAETLKALRDRYGRDFENWWESEFGYNFDRLTESEARYLAKIRGEDADTLRDRILAARQGDGNGVGNERVRQDAPPADARGTGSDSVKFSRSSGQQATQTTVPPTETRFQAAQRKAQDKLNRFTVIKEWLAEQGITLSELADVHKTEERMHSRFANKAEDFREKRVKPLVDKIQRAGFSMDDVAKFLHAQHAKERNDQIAKVNKNMPDGGSGMTNAEAAAILAASSPELAALANELRSITVDTKNILLDSGLISKDVADAWDGAYQHYVPLKGGPDDEAGGKGTGKGLSVREKQRRALGHEAREDDTREDGEWIIENILGDHERALMQAEKNRVFQALLKMAIETSPLNLITINKPEKRQILKNQASYVVRVKGRPVESFTTKEAANLFKQAVALSQKGVSPADITIEKTYDQTVALMASPMPGPDEATGYVNGQLVRVQFNDDLLARAYNNMGAESLGKILQAGRALNNYFSKIYTGYNPEFIFVNVIRDFTTGLGNVTGEEGIGMAMKSAMNYPKRFAELFRYALTGNETQWVKMYREDGGNTGAAYLSDLERLGSEIQTEYKAFQGVAANLKNRDYKGAARAAMRKVFDRTLVYIEHVNQAGENAMRLAVYQAMIESGRPRREAASLAKNVTVNFNRKGELGAQANALYLFFNASVQGTAAVAHAHFKGKHRAQAWGFSSAIIGMGYLLSLLAAEADEEEYEKTSEYERSRNILIPTGDGFVKIPVAFGYGFFWNFGRGMSDAQRTGDLGKAPWHIASSFVEEFTPFGAMAAGDGPDSEQAALYALPTIGQIAFSPIYNRTSMGIPMMPGSFNEHARARDLMNRNTRGTWADDLAGLLEDAGMDVSPETLKHYGRTFTGGAGMFADSTVSGANLKWHGAELDVSEIPFLRKLYTVPDVRGARARYYEAKSEADKALSDFKRAVKQGDMETANEIQAEKGELLALARLASSQKKRIKAARDRIDSIRLSGEYGKAAERHIIKNMEAEEEKIYDNYMAIFKAQTGR